MHKKILIAIDDTEVREAVIAEGLEVARRYDADVLFFYVLPNYVMPVMDGPVPTEWMPVEVERSAKLKAAKLLSEAVTRAQHSNVRCKQGIGSGTDAADCISREAVARKCDLIVIGSHGRTALQRFIMGSVVTRLITVAPMPVLVCKRPVNSRMQPGVAMPVVPRRAKAQRRMLATA